jgi:hypothetical protein
MIVSVWQNNIMKEKRGNQTLYIFRTRFSMNLQEIKRPTMNVGLFIIKLVVRKNQ